MNKQETAQLLAVIKTAYPAFEITEMVMRLWHDFLTDVSFERAQKNLREHISTNHFPPAIADVVKQKQPERICGDIRTLEETQQLLAEIDEMERNAVPMPEHIRLKFEARKALPPGGEKE
jgi:hypothetical protein